jgi:2-(acetamidomethylene)succinate hydrolase
MDMHAASATEEGRRFELEGARLWGKVLGKGRPVLLLHGVTANAYVWEPVAELLSGSLSVVAVDQRGHGRTGPAADGDYTAAAFARDVAGIAAAMGEPLLVVGHSLGARNAVEAAARHPGTVAGVVAIDFTPFIEPPALETLGARVAAGDRSFADLGEVRAYLRQRYPLLPDDAIKRRALHGYCKIAGGRLRPLADPEAMRLSCEGLAEELAPALARMQVPGVLVRGASSALVSPEAFRRTQRLRPDLPAIEVTGADHYVPEERPAAVADIVLRFADRFSAERANNRVAGEG